MKKLKFSAIFLTLVLLMSLAAAPAALALDAPSTVSGSILMLDVDSGQPIFEKEADKTVYPASLTKIMTVLLAVEAIERGEISPADNVTASANITFDLTEDGSTSGITVGETMSLESFMYCAMLGSANEACNAIAEYVGGGSISAFVTRMNERARELGCTGTSFANTHGLPNNAHYTTARDMATISREAISHPLFMQLCNTVSITLPATNKAGTRTLSNTNGLINNDSPMYPGYLYEGAAGVKTGHTSAAGYCLVSTAEREGVNLLCVVMGGQSQAKADKTEFSNFTDSITMYDWAFENFSYRDVLKTTDLIEDVPVSMGNNGEFVTVHPQDPVKALLANDDNLEGFEQKIVIYSKETGEKLVAPVDAGQALGEITIEKDGKVYGKTQLVASTSIDLSYSRYIGNRIGSTLKNPWVIILIIVLLALAAGYIFLVLRYRTSKKTYIEQMERKKRDAERIKAEREEVKSSTGARPKVQAIRYFDAEPSEGNQEKTEDAQEVPEDKNSERDYFEEFFSKK